MAPWTSWKWVRLFERFSHLHLETCGTVSDCLKDNDAVGQQKEEPGTLGDKILNREIYASSSDAIDCFFFSEKIDWKGNGKSANFA